MTDSMLNRALQWRHIDPNNGDVVCDKCQGSGVRVYGNTSTWRGGIGGASITPDVCDSCWGSGAVNRPWFNLKTKINR